MKAKIVLLLTIPFLCFLAAATGWLLIPDSLKGEIIARGAYPLSLLILFSILFQSFKAFRHTHLGRFMQANKGILVFSVLIVGIYSQVDHRANKVILDEVILQGSAIQLTANNEYRVPQYAHNLEVKYTTFEGVADKRPPLFPVLLSCLHRLLGYSQENGFILNALLGFLLFFTLGKIGAYYYPRFGGYLLMGLIASLPLVSQNITSQHLEVLYLCLIANLYLLTLQIMVDGRGERLSLSYLIAAAIALTRYEGLIFYAVPFLTHFLLILEGRKPNRIHWPFWISPAVVLFIFILLGHVNNFPEYWQLDDMQNKVAFGPLYWVQNTAALLEFLTNSNRNYSGSFLLSTIGAAAVPCTLYLVIKNLIGRRLDGNREAFPLFVFIVCAIIFLSVIFLYHWGNVNSHVTARFLLFPFLVMGISILYSLKMNPPFFLLLALVFAVFSSITGQLLYRDQLSPAVVLVVGGLLAGFWASWKGVPPSKLSKGSLAFIALYVLTETLPAINERAYERNYVPMQRTAIYLDWIDRYGDGNCIFVGDTSLYGILAQESATCIYRFAFNPRILTGIRKRGLFKEVYILQEVTIDIHGNVTPVEDCVLPSEVETELVEFHRISSKFAVRMTRVTGLRPTEKEAVSASEEQPAPAVQGN